MKNHVITLVVFNFFLGASISLSGTTGKIVGSVRDAKTEEPLPGANIFIEGSTLGAFSDPDGQFFMLNVPPGIYNVKTTMMGFKETTLQGVRIKIDQTTQANFKLEPTVIEGGEVTIVAGRPKVELDLTASKQTMTSQEIRQSWGTELNEVISDLPGVNINGGIRGGFGLHDAYSVDGMDMRDVGSNTNFKTVNLSAIKHMELLTGGFNAEYGQANGAILNIVTKDSRDRIHGNISYKMRPAGKYHWGRDIYSEDGFHRTIMCTPEFWNPDKTWRTEWMAPDEARQGYTGSIDTFISMTPEQRAEWWKNFVNDESTHPQMNYTDRMEWEIEATLYGSITPKLGYLISGQFKEGVERYPSSLKYNPEMNFQWNLSYHPIKNTKINVTGIYTKLENSGWPKTNYYSSEDTHHYASALPYVKSPYNKFAYWLWGNASSSLWETRAPEYVKYLNLQAKLTHTLSPKTYLEIALQHSRMRYLSTFHDIMKFGYYDETNVSVYEKLPVFFQQLKWGLPGDMWKYLINSQSKAIKADLVSQVTDHHQIKTGGIFSYNKFDKILHDFQEDGGAYDWHITDLASTVSHPFEGGFYIQDKIESEGIVINAGVRVDFFNANKNVSANFYDPLMLSDNTVGHIPAVSSNGDTLFDIGHISWNPDGSGPGYKATPSRWAVSPRFGISHPISENTVLHFMYGEFVQRPAWQKISGPVVAEVESEQTPKPEEGSSEMKIDPDSTWVHYNFYTFKTPNPALEYEKMTQYEVGIVQSIADIFTLGVTMYYKDAYDLTSAGLSQGSPELQISETSYNVEGQMGPTIYGDPTNPTSRSKGHIGFFETYVNGAWAKVRGIETTFGTRFWHINAELNYTLSFLTTGVYFFNQLYKYFPEKNQISSDTPNNNDEGINGTNDDSWNPNNSAYLKITANSPKNFGPSLAGVHPFAGWTIHTSTTWAQGRRFTYYSPGAAPELRVPNNRRWKDKWNTNMSIMKRIGLFKNINSTFTIQIRNLFNRKHLKIPGSESWYTPNGELINYFENGLLLRNDVTKEPLEWLWYSNHPREIYVGMSLEF